ncbi:MAG TPA: prenyltransferase/squalene oxidase repeat-containing protein [Candidatus Angelobacter sp.]|nr:prenyltransferase/squalene oxidase repeat-containing protein [Candidatus Angelobacter sp.]
MRFLLCLIAAFGLANQSLAAPPDARDAAINRALLFLQRTASNDVGVARFGADILWCFYTISHTAADRTLSASAARMGRELALRWRKTHQHVPAKATANDVFLLVSGAYSADRLGVPDPRFKSELRDAARKFSAKDFFGFDPARGPRLDDPTRYDLWCEGLITTYFGDAYGIFLGAHYHDVAQWLPQLRPFAGHEGDTDFDAFYAATHLIYTLNRYNERRISVTLLPDEIAFLRGKLADAIDDENPEMVGEALDCLKSAGFERDPQVRKGIEFLLASQNDDGSWAGGPDDPYTAYHSAWTGIDGLRDYHFHGKVKHLPAR